MENSLTRRGFVAGGAAALVAAGLAGSSKLAHAEETEETEELAEDSIEWDLETEVLVCGYGGAGASCAIEASDNGAQVLIIEKAALPGGSMARCGGCIMGAGTRVQEELGVEDSADGLYDWIQTCVNESYNLCPDDIIRVYADESGENVNWMMDLCTEYCGHDLFEIDWATENENAQGNEATGDEGNGVTSGCLNAVGCEYESFGISSDEAVPRCHWAHSYDGASNSGPELFDPLYECINSKIEEGSITVQYNTALEEFIMDDDGAVIGVVASTDDGEINIKATKGVMLATGGFCASDSMRMRFCQDSLGYTTYMCHDCTGDGIQAAMKIGADLYNMCNYYPIEVAQTYQYATKYNDVYNSWLDMDETGTMEVPEKNLAECHGGVRINTDAQVLDVEGNVIPHLYASGNDVGTNIFGVPGNYPGCGCYVSFAVCYGRIAGRNLAAEEEGVNVVVEADPFTDEDVVINIVEEEEEETEVDLTDATYVDGTYDGVGQGRGGEIYITIEITDGVISVLELTDEGETVGIGGHEAIEDGTYAEQIEEAQGVDIDGVSGATLTTDGVIEALTDALSQAVASDETEETEETEEETEEAAEEDEEEAEE